MIIIIIVLFYLYNNIKCFILLPRNIFLCLYSSKLFDIESFTFVHLSKMEEINFKFIVYTMHVKEMSNLHTHTHLKGIHLGLKSTLAYERKVEGIGK